MMKEVTDLVTNSYWSPFHWSLIHGEQLVTKISGQFSHQN